MTVDMDYMKMLVGVHPDAIRINYNVMCYTFQVLGGQMNMFIEVSVAGIDAVFSMFIDRGAQHTVMLLYTQTHLLVKHGSGRAGIFKGN